jgi:nitrogen fixation protein FixH
MTDAFSNENGDGYERRWTGLAVLLTLLGFFGVVFAVNGVMIFAALSTLTGVDTDSAYQAGRRFEHDVVMAHAQDARHWQVDAKVTAAADHERRVFIVARDATGQPLTGMTLSLTFERPTDRRLDRAVDVAEDSPGNFHGSAAIAAGQWDLVIALAHDGDQMFRSRNRVVLK